jgi:hypothetical protein
MAKFLVPPPKNSEILFGVGSKAYDQLHERKKASDYAHMTFNAHNDAGHGWLAVPRDLLKELGIEKSISEYSYQSKSGKTVYLEEDADGTLFQKRYEEKFGKKPAYESKDDGTTSPIRSYPSFLSEEKLKDTRWKEFEDAGAKPYINTIDGTKWYYKTEVEDEQGRWNDSYETIRGEYVIHNGKYHHVYM